MKLKKYKLIVVLMMMVGIVCIFSSCENGSAEEIGSTETITATAVTELETEPAATTATTERTTSTTESTTAKTTTKTTTTTKATVPTKSTDALQQADIKQTAKPTIEATAAPKVTTAKPAAQKPGTPTTTAAPKGHYETIHHEAVTEQVWVVDVLAETHYKLVCYCGQEFYWPDAYEKYVAHDEAACLNGDYSHYGYQNIPYETEEQGHYETRVIQEAYDEQVWVWD